MLHFPNIQSFTQTGIQHDFPDPQKTLLWKNTIKAVETQHVSTLIFLLLLIPLKKKWPNKQFSPQCGAHFRHSRAFANVDDGDAMMGNLRLLVHVDDTEDEDVQIMSTLHLNYL